MGRVQVAVEAPGTVAAAEALWMDTRRWPSFVDGLAHVARVDEPWPEPGGRLLWDSRPGGRGRVVERVLERRPGEGQTVGVEDERLEGEQSVSFAPGPEGVTVSLALDYRLKQGGPVRAVVDALFIRRALGDSLRRTAVRFARELAAEAEGLR